MRSLISIAILALLATTGPVLAWAADKKGCQDHPMISRMPKYDLWSCESSYDEVGFVANGKTTTVEGKRAKLEYSWSSEQEPHPSFFQIRKNYSTAIRSIGGTVLEDAERRLVGTIKKPDKEVWVALEAFNDGKDYELVIVEKESTPQDVQANALFDAIQKTGVAVVYIKFDTAKWDIKPESEDIVVQIASMLQSNPALKVSVEGHTDNVGTPASNKTLSENRARSVVSGLVAKGIDSGRLRAVGRGQDASIADNRTEEGRAKNRRVEIVKQ